MPELKYSDLISCFRKDIMVVKELKIHDFKVMIDANVPFERYPLNPILTPEMVNRVWRNPAHQVVTVHNAGVAEYNGSILLLFRSHLRCGKSVIGLAASINGFDTWKVAPVPILLPAQLNDKFAPGVNQDLQIEMESGGVEDARITKIDDEFAITYNAYDAKVKNKVRVCLAATVDFENIIRYGPIADYNMRNVVLFPKYTNRGYAALFRPNDSITGDIGGTFTEIKIGFTNNWKSGRWQIEPGPIMKTGWGPSAFSDKIGPGTPPLESPFGWISFFHGVRNTMAGNPYVLGVALHDINQPEKVKMSSIPILFPCASDCLVERSGYVHVPQVVFSCGATRLENGVIQLFYGGNDTVMNCAVSHEELLVDLCEKYGQDPLSGKLLYKL
jgi:predicted GH43/DUF377 family glycosyl hydrolase